MTYTFTCFGVLLVIRWTLLWFAIALASLVIKDLPWVTLVIADALARFGILDVIWWTLLRFAFALAFLGIEDFPWVTLAFADAITLWTPHKVPWALIVWAHALATFPVEHIRLRADLLADAVTRARIPHKRRVAPLLWAFAVAGPRVEDPWPEAEERLALALARFRVELQVVVLAVEAPIAYAAASFRIEDIRRFAAEVLLALTRTCLGIEELVVLALLYLTAVAASPEVRVDVPGCLVVVVVGAGPVVGIPVVVVWRWVVPQPPVANGVLVGFVGAGSGPYTLPQAGDVGTLLAAALKLVLEPDQLHADGDVANQTPAVETLEHHNEPLANDGLPGEAGRLVWAVEPVTAAD